jgi:pimeloyl-ACP methyl ester carboxylesterase
MQAQKNLLLLAACATVLLALPLWNLGMITWLHWRNPVPGAFYSINGRQMHLYCTGTEAPTIVIEAAASADWLGWQGVQSKLSPTTRVCTYDRAGHGWSQPRNGPRDAEVIAQELHALLDHARIQRPLVLAGHSAGGLYVREYARAFPMEVTGVVLIDSSSPEQIDELPGFRRAYEEEKRDFVRQVRWQKLRVWSGWERLMGKCRNAPSPELAHLAGQYAAEMCRPEYVGGEDSELPYFETTSMQAARLTGFGTVPLLIVSQDPEQRPDGMTADAIAEQSVWAREQEALKSLSPLSWRVIARGAGHGVHHDRLDIVVREMTRLITYLRDGIEPPWGSTTIQ